MTRICGMASNRGRNLRHLEAQAPGGAELAVVLSNEPDAPVLDWATDRGIPTEVEPLGGDTREGHEERIVEALADHEVDLVCLDGYMRILTSTFIDAMPLALNVHPSLLPAFPGMDAWGDALEAGVAVTGCTVHVVTEEVDGGPIVTQEPVPVYDDDTRERLKERVLYAGEFAAYPRAVRWVAEGKVTVADDRSSVQVAGDDPGDFPARRVWTADRTTTLRYGENPHQDAALYVDPTGEEASVVDAAHRNPGAKAPSYNNYNDADAALSLVKEFDEPAAAVIKHTNPAGCATADDLATAYERALATDPMSAFGGVVALNRPCDAATAEQITDSFKEVVVAPGYDGDGLSVLQEEENLRVFDVGPLDSGGVRSAFTGEDPTEGLMEKPLVGGRLVQDRDRQRLTDADLEVVTERRPTDAQMASMLFAWQTIKHVKSNAIVFATGTETVGIGAGQMSRVDAVRLAAMKADEHAEGKTAAGAVMASDAFFPFPDGIERAAAAGIEAVIQPGGSVNDDDVIAAADDHGLAMVFTGHRAFRHD